jgi:hypothetical protein
MRSFIYRVHIWLGLIVAVPVLAWASSGLLYALPKAVEGGRVETIDETRVRILPSEALTRASEFAGRKLPTTALTLLMREGRPVYQAVGGLGADQDTSARGADAVLSTGTLLFLCRLVAGSVVVGAIGTRLHLSSVGSVFEFDDVVWETNKTQLVPCRFLYLTS